MPLDVHDGQDSNTLVLIDGRTLERECFVRFLELSRPAQPVQAYGSVSEWRDASGQSPSPSVILLNIGERLVSDPVIAGDLRALATEAGNTPVVVLARSEELREMIVALELGARGYIPATVGVDTILEAARLTSLGGVFLPTASILLLRESLVPDAELVEADIFREHLTARQAAVAQELMHGKANKIIAYELKMSESTVKVHVRNIMKKLRATNRTEAAFKLIALGRA